MKCPLYAPDEYGCVTAISDCDYALTPHSACRCSKGWITFWTEAEREGLKAMGEQYQNQEWRWLKPWFDVGVLATIRAYVAASRKVKESK